MVVEEGDIIEIRYRGWKKSNGEVFEDNEDKSKPPVSMTVGSKDFIVGLNQGVLGMSEGEMRKLDIPKERAYGARRHELVQSIPRMQLLGKAEPKIGKVLVLKNEAGGVFPAIIKDISRDTVILDMNPPLAGEDLIFNVKVERIVKKAKK